MKGTLKLLLKRYSQQSFSQCGEDLIINYVFQLRGIKKPSYIDVGANHPYFISNTAFFYKRGCRGINIDANPNLISLFKFARPKDVNLNLGISDQKDFLNFYIMEDPTLSTFSNDERIRMQEAGKTMKGIEKINVNTISNVLDEYNGGRFPDLLSLDVEGFDFQILKSISFERHSPKIICVEAAEYSSTGAGARRHDMIDFLRTNGYYEYANTNLNAIMVKNDFWFI